MSLPHVTQVLAPFQDFSRISPEVLEHAAQRGTTVHQACAIYAEAEFWAPPLDAEADPYFQSFQRWFDERVFQVLGVEMRVVHRAHGYTGTLDLVVVIMGDTLPTIIDIKTPATTNPAWKAQLAAYKAAWEDMTSQKAGRVASLRLRANGGRALLDEYTADSARDFAGFLAALNAWKYFKGDKV